ncbi:MAG: multiubiquitin domain-containing protein [Burkholderiaceae bacterium]
MKSEESPSQDDNLNNKADQQDIPPHLDDQNEKEDKDHKHETEVTVNEQPVVIKEKTATGAQIKAAAIAQGVLIEQNFILQEELPNGTSQIIGDNDEVKIRSHLRFTAIAPDDNS